jgi:exopolyphosphatase/guanosine-5'-triphosphate,3'-diphosphate pyrophosphatase
MKFGAIDIGTNAARLLIGEVCQDEGHSYIKKLSYTRLPLRLGGDVFDYGEITPKKEEEFIKTMKAFQLIADIFDVKELRACATSAMREAKNGEKVAKSIAKETGIKIEVISGDEEARLIFGTFFLLDFDKTTPFIVIDVGGGSTEISVFERGERVAAKSFEVGTVRTLKGKTNDTIWGEIGSWLHKNIDESIPHNYFATGGNINKIHKILGVKQFENIKLDEMLTLRDELARYNLEDRMEKFQLKPDRADVIIPACDIYSYIFKELNVNSFAVPKVGLSDGIIYDLHLKHHSKDDRSLKTKKKQVKIN